MWPYDITLYINAIDISVFAHFSLITYREDISSDFFVLCDTAFKFKYYNIIFNILDKPLRVNSCAT